ncbi:hypothetical protein M3Y98_00591900 [Aphelenchoides besseyi]|nr:hypothetical protein M3Y98_00591900 [Aphelenchoides besseyi]
MTIDLEDILEEWEKEAATSSAPETDHFLEEQLAFGPTRQLIMAYLERRAIELGATERIENFCFDQHSKGVKSMLQMRENVAQSAQFLLPRPLRLEILRMAVEFVEKFRPSEENSHVDSLFHEQRNGLSSNDFFYSDQSTSTTSSVGAASELSRNTNE